MMFLDKKPRNVLLLLELACHHVALGPVCNEVSAVIPPIFMSLAMTFYSQNMFGM
jgi:hypothetical protein